MKVKIKQNAIALALSTVGRAINPNNTLPILNNILIQAQENSLIFSATNLEIAITLNMQANVVEEGSITVPAKLISNYVNLLPNEELTIETTEDLNVKIHAKKSDTKIKGLKSDDFPSIPQIKEAITSFELKAADLEKAINETYFSASLNTSRPILSGVYISAEEDNLILAATDSYRLSERKVKLSSKVDKSVNCIVPSRTALEFAKILGNFSKESVKVTIAKNQILFEVEEIKLLSRLIEGNFPDYTKIIPEEVTTKIKVNASDLSQALKRVNLFAREVNNAITLEADKALKKLTVYTEETRVGEEKTYLDVEIIGENNKISLNSQYLLDVLSVKEGEKIVLGLNEKLSPVKVQPEKTEGYVYIIMPLKV